MTEVFEFTKDQLIEAFKIYNQEYLQNPDLFGEIEANDDSARLQVEKLLSILQRIE